MGQLTLTNTSTCLGHIIAAPKLIKAELSDKRSVILIRKINEWLLILIRRVWLFLSHMKRRDNICNFLLTHSGMELSNSFLNEAQLRKTPKSLSLKWFLFSSPSGTWIDRWWAAPGCTTRRASWTRTRWTSASGRDGSSSHSTSSHSSTISTGKMISKRTCREHFILLSHNLLVTNSITHVRVIFLSAWSTPSSPLNWESWSMERNSQSRFKRRNISKIGYPILIKLVKLIQNTCPLSAQV